MVRIYGTLAGRGTRLGRGLLMRSLSQGGTYSLQTEPVHCRGRELQARVGESWQCWQDHVEINMAISHVRHYHFVKVFNRPLAC